MLTQSLDWVRLWLSQQRPLLGRGPLRLFATSFATANEEDRRRPCRNLRPPPWWPGTLARNKERAPNCPLLAVNFQLITKLIKLLRTALPEPRP
jgi:hypothetical protein